MLCVLALRISHPPADSLTPRLDRALAAQSYVTEEVKGAKFLRKAFKISMNFEASKSLRGVH